MFLNFKKLIFLAFVSLVFFVFNIVIAGYRPPFGGEYTNLCGSGESATFYSCPADCDINSGRCSTHSNEWMYVFVCNGKRTVCDEWPIAGIFGPHSTTYLTNFASVGSDKTVQIDIFNKDCLKEPPCTLTDNMRGVIVWWSGKKVPPSVRTLPPVETL